MREILFRGKRIDNGEWAYGYYAESHRSMNSKIKPHKAWIVESFASNGGWLTPMIRRAIYDETVGQYTGLTDKNGTKIFEGDIVKTKYGRLCQVAWFSSPCHQGWDLIPIETTQKAPDNYDVWASKNLKVVGNVHDGGAYD